MNLKPLSAALVGAGIAVVGTAGAIDLPKWLKSDTPVAAAPQQLASPEKVVPPAPLAAVPGQVPNYRAIVKQAAPAVVGITVEGMHKVSAEDSPACPTAWKTIRSSSSSAACPACRPARPAEPVDAVQGHGLGLHHQLRRPGADQRPRRARRQGRDRQAERPARVQGQGARHRHRDRHRRAAHRRQGPAGGAPRRPEEPRGRRPGAGDRRAVTASSRPRRRASSAPRAARCRATRWCPSSRPTPRSTPATRAARCSTAAARWSASTRRSIRSSGGYQGLSFAIPIDVALKVKDQIVATGKAQHGAARRDGAGPEPVARRFVRPEAGRTARWSRASRRTAPRPRRA